jgi:phage-related minor tail protein
MSEREAMSDLKKWALGIASALVVALLSGIGSTAWGLYNRVHDVEKENMRLEGELKAAEKVNIAQQKEIDRLWDSLTDLWQNASEAVSAEAIPR